MLPDCRPMPVCHLIHDLGPGGAEHVLVDLARVAVGAGIDLRVVSMMPLAGRRYPPLLQEAGVPVGSLDLASRWDPRGPGRLVRLLEADPPAILHSHLKHADLLAGYAAGRLGIPHVSTLHLVESEVRGINRFKRGLAARRRIRTATLTIAVSEAVRRWYLATYPADPSRLVVVPNGIPDPGLAPAAIRSRMRAALGAGEGTVVAATVAVMRPGKGHDDLLRAAVGLDGGVLFVLAGSGPDEPRLRREAARLGIGDRVVFAGFREDVAAFLAAADLVVHPSIADALPTALIHALAAGLPVIASDVGGIPEIVTPDVGVLVPPSDPAALREAIAALAGDPGRRAGMGSAARERFLSRFEATEWAARLRSLYESAASRRAARVHW